MIDLVDLVNEEGCCVSAALNSCFRPTSGLPDWLVGPDLQRPTLVTVNRVYSYGNMAIYRTPYWAPRWLTASYFAVIVGAIRGQVSWGFALVDPPT